MERSLLDWIRRQGGQFQTHLKIGRLGVIFLFISYHYVVSVLDLKFKLNITIYDIQNSYFEEILTVDLLQMVTLKLPSSPRTSCGCNWRSCCVKHLWLFITKTFFFEVMVLNHKGWMCYIALGVTAQSCTLP